MTLLLFVNAKIKLVSDKLQGFIMRNFEDLSQVFTLEASYGKKCKTC